MHPAACLLIDWLWQEGCGLSLPCRHIFDDIFDDHSIISHLGHIRQFHLNLHLARTTHLMMMVFYLDAPVFHLHADTASQIIPHILRRRHMITALMGHLITVISPAIKAHIPCRLSGVDLVAALSRRHLETCRIKQIKLKFRSDHHGIRNAALLHVFHRPQGNILRILVKRLIFLFSDHTHISAHGQCRHLCKRIYISRIRIRQKYHVALLDRRISVVGTIKADSVHKSILIEPLHRYRDMPPAPVDVRHLKVDHADLLLLAQFPDFFAFAHSPIPRFLFPLLFCWIITLNLPRLSSAAGSVRHEI